jgi:hypothetical protein
MESFGNLAVKTPEFRRQFPENAAGPHPPARKAP